ncbi:MAG: hypothetical protein HOF35_01155 [Bacteroidetes bacterium]|nr:hypothetical protein [Bacteroidota bacterium]MBT7996554.1 hypothetical protein [Bacteroidota bacterium]
MSQLLQIGNVTSGYRSIRSGKEYDKLFTKPDKRDRVIIEDGEVDQTVNLMKKVVWKYLDDTKQIAKLLRGNSPQATSKKIWDFLYHHIQYRLDEKGLEQLRRPARSWYERHTGIDCDCFSIFASSILTNLKIPQSFRITKYGKDVFQHVYVVVPTGSSTYIIDPVLSKANYEKPFTEKKDFTMNLDGINVAVLSGPTGNDLYDTIMSTDLEGLELGNTNEQQDSEALFSYLVKTRNTIIQNPDTVSFFEDPHGFAEMLDYAIKYWHTPNRDKALAILAQSEDEFNLMHGLDGYEDDLDEELLGRIIRKKAKKKAPPKKFFKNLKSSSGNIKKGLKKVVKGVIRYNPVTAAARGGFLIAMKINLKKMASKLIWAYFSKEEAINKGISEGRWNQAKKALERVERLFADKLQGKRENLKKAIINGRAGKKADVGELGSLGEPISATAAAAMITAATPVIVATIKILKDSGLLSKDVSEKIDVNEQVVQKLSSQQANEDYADFDIPNGDKAEAQKDTPNNSAVNFLKKNPMVVVGGLAAIGGIGYLLLSGDKSKKQNTKALAGTKKASTKKGKQTKSDKLKSIKIG